MTKSPEFQNKQRHEYKSKVRPNLGNETYTQL